MLRVNGLTKRYLLNGRPRTLFSDLSFELPRDGRLALLGRNGQGKSTLIKLLGGVIGPTAGDIRWGMTCSWPLGFGGAFQGGMTGLDNIRFLARIYQRDEGPLIRRVDDFAELGEALTMPVKYYSAGMRARLAFGLSIAIEFDCYLIDEVISVGDALFHEKSERELFEHRRDRAFVIASHDLGFLKRHCNGGIVIDRGKAKLFNNIDLAIDIYASIWDHSHSTETLSSQDANLYYSDEPLDADNVKSF